jgi:hypothetical protein
MKKPGDLSDELRRALGMPTGLVSNSDLVKIYYYTLLYNEKKISDGHFSM